MNKTFTLQEAQTLLPVLGALLQRAQESALRAAQLELEMQQLGQRIFLSGGMHVNVVAAARRRGEREKAAQQAKSILAEIDEIGVTVQDLGEGLLDFPCQVEGNAVMLCWKLGEPAITHWHEAEAGSEERKLLDARFGKGERLN